MAEYLQLQPKVQELVTHDRFSRGHTCFAARYEGRLICGCLGNPSSNSHVPLCVVVPLPDKTIYFYDLFTEPGFRGLSIQAALCSHMVRYFGAKGFQRVMTGVVPENKPSLRVYGRCGFRPYEMIRSVMLEPFRRLLPAASHMHDR